MSSIGGTRWYAASIDITSIPAAADINFGVITKTEV